MSVLYVAFLSLTVATLHRSLFLILVPYKRAPSTGLYSLHSSYFLSNILHIRLLFYSRAFFFLRLLLFLLQMLGSNTALYAIFTKPLYVRNRQVLLPVFLFL